MVFRFISGCAGGTPLALGGGTIADLTSLKQRASAMTLFSLGPLTGPVRTRCRWTQCNIHVDLLRSSARSSGVSSPRRLVGAGRFGCLPLLAVPLQLPPLPSCVRRIPRSFWSEKLNISVPLPGTKTSCPSSPAPIQPAGLTQALVRPITLLLRSPILLVISLYVALVFGLLYILFTTFSPVFVGKYGFTTSTSGLVYLGLGIALLFDVLLFGALNMRVQAAVLKASGLPRPQPEHRLVLMIILSPFVSLGMFMYGWTVHYTVHWIVPVIATTFIGFGALFVVVSSIGHQTSVAYTR